MKLATVFGAFSASSLRVMSPWLVVSLICDMVGGSLLFRNDLDALDDDRRHRYVAVRPDTGGWRLGNLVDDLHALHDLAEHGVTPTVEGRIVEVGVVGVVDEELGGGRMRRVGAGHGQRAAGVLEPVLGLVLDRVAGRLLVHLGVKAATLDHEARDDAMENGF